MRCQLQRVVVMRGVQRVMYLLASMVCAVPGKSGPRNARGQEQNVFK